ncbi:hypothetical protein NW762_003247 [Fusarium torreyae]|uniref:ASST-domain-containing protein n=1 Tax=Fusarium torreyae TaxID=1237075 RepID=A0A9W8S907_9HYPO|nr:hypothetical protein NW762_003247 [Fusarium torreyae]
MVVISGSPWAKRLIFTAISLNILFWWYCFSIPGSDDVVSPPPALPPREGVQDGQPGGKVLAPDAAKAQKGAAKVAAAGKALVQASKEAKSGETLVEEKSLKNFNSWSNFDVVRPRNEKTFAHRRFRSSPHKSPHIEWLPNKKELAKGYIFITVQSTGIEKGLVQTGSFIMKQNAEMIYAHDTEPYGSEGLQVQTMNNERYMTLWRGAQKQGHGFGEVIIMDEGYEKTTIKLDQIDAAISNMFGQKFLSTLDFHEQELTPRGTILVTAYNTTEYNLTAMGGPEKGYIADSMFFEIDIETQDVLFSWSALQHFYPEDSMQPLISTKGNGGPRSPYDFFNLNSVQAVGYDSFLISSRHFWSVFLISRSTGGILWELRGNAKGGDFGALPPDGRFRWQNHVRAHQVTSKGMVISMLDNHNSHEDTGKTPSRGLILHVKLPPNRSEKPQVLRTLQPDVARFSQDFGNYQLGLSNGNQLISYGDGGVVHEFGPDDGHDLRWQGRFGFDGAVRSYRAYKYQWKGTPTHWSPSLVLEKRGESVVGFVSWNGATDIEAYNVYAVEKARAPMRLLGKARVWGFETAFDLTSKFNESNCVVVAAVRDDQEIRQSNLGCIEGKTFVSTFVDSKGKEVGDSVVANDGIVQKVMGFFS